MLTTELRRLAIALKLAFLLFLSFVPSAPALADTTPHPELWGYIDKSGVFQIPRKFSRAADFADGIARVSEPGHDYHDSFYITTDGRHIIDIPMDSRNLSDFSQGLAVVQTDEGLFGYMDRTGSFKIKPQYRGAGPFSEGLAAVELGIDTVNYLRTDLMLPQPGKVGFIDLAGQLVIPPTFQVDVDTFQMSSAFHEGRARVRVYDKLGYVSREGALVVKPDYIYAGSFSEGLVSVRKGSKGTYLSRQYSIDGPYKYIDQFGSQPFSVASEVPGNLGPFKIGQFSEGMAFVMEPSRTRAGFIDRTGKFVITLDSPNSVGYAFSEGMAHVLTSKDQHIFIDKSGKKVGSHVFEGAREFSETLAAAKQGDSWGFIDRTGDFVIPPIFKEVGNFHDGLAPVLLQAKHH